MGRRSGEEVRWGEEEVARRGGGGEVGRGELCFTIGPVELARTCTCTPYDEIS